MSVNANITSVLEVQIGGEWVIIGDRGAPLQVSVDGDKYDIDTTIAGNYIRQVIWQDGDGGLADFDILAIEADKDCYLELTIDRAGTPAYATFKILADVPQIFTTDDLLAAITVTTTQTTPDQIDQVAVQSDEAADDTSVRVLLIT